MKCGADGSVDDGVRVAVSHALGWLVVGNAVGLWMAILVIRPEWGISHLAYGRWVPVHLNVQLYGWTALPLVAWLLWMYEVGKSRWKEWAAAAVWAWTAALALGVVGWLGGETSGKIFLDWKGGALAGFMLALVMLWLVLAAAWKERVRGWSGLRGWFSLGGLVGLAAVPVAMVVAASPRLYPPVDRLTGGPTGSSLLGSSLIVVGLMLLLPRMAAVGEKGRAGWGLWGYFGFCWAYFGVAEWVGGTHFDWWQHVSLLWMPPWAWLLWREWSRFEWPEASRGWRVAMFGWWGALVCTGYLMYFPQVLDRLKFTQGLVAHSHLAMAGFTTSFGALLVVLLTGRKLGSGWSVALWHGAVVCMIFTLAAVGWREGGEASWMLMNPRWRELGFLVRAGCGGVMLAVSVGWFFQWNRGR